jgi:hypothetical protein
MEVPAYQILLKLRPGLLAPIGHFIEFLLGAQKPDFRTLGDCAAAEIGM